MRRERIVNIKHILEEEELMKEVQEFDDIQSQEQESKKGGEENGRSKKQNTRG